MPAAGSRSVQKGSVQLGSVQKGSAQLGSAGGEAPGGGSGSQGHTPAARSVGLARCTFVDPTRSTYNYYTGQTTPGRTLVTEIRYPSLEAPKGSQPLDAPPAPKQGGYPTIVFAEGYDVTPTSYALLLDAWVRAGFVVVAPLFPDTNAHAIAAMHGVDTEADDVNEPADVAFVTREVLQDSTSSSASCEILHGLIDERKIALAGQSDGAQVVAALVYDNAFSGVLGSLSYTAVAVLSGDEIGSGTYVAGPSSPPLLVVQSNADACNPPEEAVDLYDAVPTARKWFLTLYGALHLPPYDGRDAPAFAVVSAVTSRFFELGSSGSEPSAGFLALGDSSPLVARLSTGPDAPSLPVLAFNRASCYLQ